MKINFATTSSFTNQRKDFFFARRRREGEGSVFFFLFSSKTLENNFEVSDIRCFCYEGFLSTFCYTIATIRPQLPAYDDNFFCKPSFFHTYRILYCHRQHFHHRKGKEKTRAQITGKLNRRQPLFFYTHTKMPPPPFTKIQF